MTMKKRILSVLLCLLMCLSLFPASAFAAELPEEEVIEQDTVLADPPEAEQPAEAEAPAEEVAAAEPVEEPDEGEEPAPADEPETPDVPAGEAEAVPEESTEGEEPSDEPEEEEDSEASEEEDIEIVVQQPIITYIPEETSDDVNLLDEYAAKQLDSLRPKAPMLKAVHDSGARLEGVNQTVFYNLKNQIASVAASERTSTIMEIPVTQLGLSKLTWSLEDLGMDSVFVVDENGKKDISPEAIKKVNDEIGFDLRKVVSALLADCPYELYWYDKTLGTDFQNYGISGSNTTGITIVGSMKFYFNVIGTYFQGPPTELESGKPVRVRVKSDIGQMVSQAVATARYIASSCAGQSDYSKLCTFRDEICSRVSYNYDALAEGTEYGDPWQIIYVFDANQNTNVVCEGYAKAFQYLCDIGDLSGRMMTYTVSGTMGGGTGAGSHMWNIVHMENNKNYIVDITNCDDGSIGAPDILFLSGVNSGSVGGGYTVVIDSTNVTYEYDAKIREIFSDEELTISENSYQEDIGLHKVGEVWNVTQLKAAIDTLENDGKLSYPGEGDFYVGEDLTIPASVSFNIPNGNLYIKPNVTMTVAKLGTVTAKNAVIDGSLTVAAGGTLNVKKSGSVLKVNGALQNGGSITATSLNAAGSVQVLSGAKLTVMNLSVAGTLDNAGTVISRDPYFARSDKMLASGGVYIVQQTPKTEAALRQICSLASEKTDDAAVSYELTLGNAVTLTQNLTIPANTTLALNAAISVPAGMFFNNAGTMEVNSALSLEGGLTNSGDIKLNESAAVSVPAGMFLNNAGTMEVNSALSLEGGLTNSGNIKFNESASVSEILSNNGDIKLGQNATLTLSEYRGTGTLGIPTSGGNTSDKLIGIDTSLFEIALGYTGGYDGYILSDPVGTDPVLAISDERSLNLGGTLGVNFKMKLSDSLLADEAARAVFIYKEQETVVDFHGMGTDSKGRYVFTYRVPAKEFSNPIGLKFVSGDKIIPVIRSNGVSVPNGLMIYSCEEYCNTPTLSEKGKIAAQALQNYCAYAYIYFKDTEDVKPELVGTPDLDSVTAETLDQFKSIKSGGVDGLNYEIMSLTLKSTTEINLKFSLAQGHSIGEYSFTMDGADVTPTLKGQYYVLTIPNISGKNLDTRHTVQVTRGEQSFSVSVTALSYAYSALSLNQPDKTDRDNTCKALYLYNVAVDNYFAK